MTHEDIINKWPSLTEFAGDIGVAYGTAKAMRRRGSIPSHYWPDVVANAEKRRINGVTLKVLVSSRGSQRSALHSVEAVGA